MNELKDIVPCYEKRKKELEKGLETATSATLRACYQKAVESTNSALNYYLELSNCSEKNVNLIKQLYNNIIADAKKGNEKISALFVNNNDGIALNPDSTKILQTINSLRQAAVQSEKNVIQARATLLDTFVGIYVNGVVLLSNAFGEKILCPDYSEFYGKGIKDALISIISEIDPTHIVGIVTDLISVVAGFSLPIRGGDELLKYLEDYVASTELWIECAIQFNKFYEEKIKDLSVPTLPI